MVVEGYTDVIALHQAGVGEAVAVMGTAITPEQVQLLASHTDEVVLALDADRAGREAMLRAQRVASGKRVRLRVAGMKAGEDPADQLAGKGPGSDAADAFRALVDAADELPVFHVRMLLEDADLTSPAGRDRALDELVPVLGAMPDSITREELEREAADRLERRSGPRAPAGRAGGRAPQAAPAPVPRRENGGESDFAKAQPPRALNRREQREWALLAMAIAHPGDGEEFVRRLTPQHLSSPVMASVRDWLADHLEAPLDGLSRDEKEIHDMVWSLVSRASFEPASREAMELNFMELDLALVKDQIDAASEDGRDPPVDLQRRRAQLSERIAHFGGT